MTAKKSTSKGKAAATTAKVAAKSRAAGPRKKVASRGSKKGERRGGRQPGTRNKRTVELMDALAAAGYDPEADNPVVWMFKVYTGQMTMPVVVTGVGKDGPVNMIENVPLEPALRVKCMAEVAQYLFPKRKAVEVAGVDGAPIQVLFLNLDELEGSGVGVVPADKE